MEAMNSASHREFWLRSHTDMCADCSQPQHCALLCDVVWFGLQLRDPIEPVPVQSTFAPSNPVLLV